MTLDPETGCKYGYNAFVTATVVPAAGYLFQDWTGNVADVADTSTMTISFYMIQDRMITANFVASGLRYAAIANVEPGAGGSVVFDPPQPSEGYAVNQRVEVRPLPKDGYVFGRWAGDLAGSDVPATLRLSEHKSITAVFKANLTTISSPSEGGVVSREPDSSSTAYDLGREVIITAESAKGYRFVGWKGDASGSSKSITVTMDQPKTIEADFAKNSGSGLWLWVVIGVVGLVAALIVLRLVYPRVRRGALREELFGE